MLEDTFDSVVVYSIPMRSRFRAITHREGVLLCADGRWSEWSPFLEYSDQEAANWLKAALITDDPVTLNHHIPVNVTVPVESAKCAADRVRTSGCSTAKVKVADAGSRLDDDLVRLSAVRSALGQSGKIRVDANGAWNVDQAERALRKMSRYGIQYAEQPCASVEELAELRERIARWDEPMPIAADESIRRASDPDRVAELGAADVIVLKNQPLGGWHRCMEIAQRLGLPAVISSALETSIGLWAGLQTAAALPGLDMACGLDTLRLLSNDVVDQGLTSVDGYLDLGERPVVSDEALSRVKADRQREKWWFDRLRRCLALVGGGEQ